MNDDKIIAVIMSILLTMLLGIFILFVVLGLQYFPAPTIIFIVVATIIYKQLSKNF